MTNLEVKEWLKKNRVSPELLAGVADISFSTLASGLRGASWSKETEEKLAEAMPKIMAWKEQNSKAA